MKKIIIVFMLAISHSYAFLNIESLRQSHHDFTGLKGSLGITLLDQSGNTDKSLIGVNALNLYKQGSSSYIILGKFRYGTSFDTEDTKEGHLHLRYINSFSNFLEWELFQQTEFNEFQDLNLRLLLGTGLRIKVSQKKSYSLSIGLGAFYENEELQSHENKNNPRLNSYLSFLKKGTLFELTSTLYIQPNTENFNDYRFRFSLGLESKLGKSLRQTLQYSYRRDTRPPLSILKDDRILTAGLSYRY